jgi:RimJ/RimL family protein N-acetyltransferase
VSDSPDTARAEVNLEQPTLATRRLRLRPFRPDDASVVQRLVGDPAVASTTLNIPHPYLDGMAESWIAGHAATFSAGEAAVYAVELAATNELVGAVALRIVPEHAKAEVGYWVGKPFWGRGYCSEAVDRLLQYGFEDRGLHRIYAHHLTRNPASGRVMQKVGMQHEGKLRGHVRKWGIFEDIELYGILKEDWEQLERSEGDG